MCWPTLSTPPNFPIFLPISMYQSRAEIQRKIQPPPPSSLPPGSDFRSVLFFRRFCVMGTEVLRPQDCLRERIRVSPVGLSHRRYGNAYPHSGNYSNARCQRKPARSEQRKRYGSSEASISRSPSPDDSKSPKNLVMEKVTILRRGEPLDPQAKNMEMLKENDGGMIVTGTGRLGPDPKIVPTNIRIVEANRAMIRKADVYAGSGFYVSPSPSSLPLPSFSKKEEVPVDDSATRDLRRLLRLDL